MTEPSDGQDGAGLQTEQRPDERQYECSECDWSGRRVEYEIGLGPRCPECDSPAPFIDDDTTRNSEVTLSFTADLFERLRREPFYIGPDALGHEIHISKDSQSLGSVKNREESPDLNAWGPIFPVEDRDEVDGTRPKADGSSTGVMLEAVPKDTVEITEVHQGSATIPEKYTVVRRTNTYSGPVLKLAAGDDWEGQEGGWELQAPDRRSNLILWKAVTDKDGFIQTYIKRAEVSAHIFNVAGYDMCGSCGEPIKNPMHRRMAMIGMCTGGWDDGE